MKNQKSKSKKTKSKLEPKNKKIKIIKTKAEKELNKLKNRYKSIIKEMREIEKENEVIVENGIASESSVNDLTLQSLKDFYDFDKQKEKIINKYILQNLKRNGILKKEFDKKEQELRIISDEIKIKTIQILIEKIKTVEESLK